MYYTWSHSVSCNRGTGRSGGPHEGCETETQKPSGHKAMTQTLYVQDGMVCPGFTLNLLKFYLFKDFF